MKGKDRGFLVVSVMDPKWSKWFIRPKRKMFFEPNVSKIKSVKLEIRVCYFLYHPSFEMVEKHGIIHIYTHIYITRSSVW